MKSLGSVVHIDSDQEALVDLSGAVQPRSFSYAQLQHLANGTAAHLAIEKGTRVGILAQNSVEFLAILLGIMRAGGVAVPINYKFPDSIIRYIVTDAELPIVYADAGHAGRLPAEVDVRAMACESADHYPIVQPLANEPGMVLYTSGSTGRPKGVVLSHDSQLSMAERFGARVAGLCAIVAAPLYHMNAILTLFMFLHAGGKVVLLPRFDPRIYLQAIETYKVNALTGVPTMLAMMLREEDLIASLDFSSVHAISIGSAPLSETVAQQAGAIFSNAAISNGYGTTEAGAGMFGPHPDGLPQPSVTLGYPQPHVQVRLVNGATDREGVLEVKTPAAMNGYLNQPQKTSEKVTADGWINTGDTMRVDDNGFYFFVGRDDDMFNCSGENIYPGEIERILESDPGISECCVVPLADEIRGKVPVAFVVRAPNSAISEQAVKDIVLAAAPAYTHPRHVVFISQMPLAGTNKIDRRMLESTAAAEISRN